jgi:hypothetical protein
MKKLISISVTVNPKPWNENTNFIIKVVNLLMLKGIVPNFKHFCLMWNLDTKMFSAVRRSLLNSGSDAVPSVCLEVWNGLSSKNGGGGGWKLFHPPCNSEWRYDFFVCTEITQHNKLNANIRVTVPFNEIYSKRRGFGTNLRFLELQLQSE